MHLGPISVTPTAKGLSKRDLAIAVIADKLGIPIDQVKDDTPLGNAAHDITMVLAFKLGGAMIVGSSNMTAKQVFDQL